MSWLLCIAMLFGLGAPVYAATDTAAPVVNDAYISYYITNPQASYTEGDIIYINILLRENYDLDYARLEFLIDGSNAMISEYADSYDPKTKIASFKFLIDASIANGTWKFFYIDVSDYFGNFEMKWYFDSDAGFLRDFSFEVDNTKENNTPSTPDDFRTYDWTGCVDTKPTVSLTSSTNQLYTMVALPGSASSDVTMTHTGSSSIVIGSWGRFTEGYQLTFPAPGVYKLKFIQNVTNDSLYYYANITDHEVSTYTENEGLKIATCKTCDTTFEQVGTPSWRMENNKLVGTEYTTGLVMIGLYDENGSLINAKYCERGDEKIIGGTTFCSYTAPQFTKAELSQAEQILCFNFTEQYIPIRDRIEIF